MNVLFVSQCSGNALTETRRILDQFGERCGDRVWQTPITEDGLAVVARLLRKTARKNTAVACHWIHGRNHSELLWIIGDRRRFNAVGAVPTNMTARAVLPDEDDDWRTGEGCRLLAALAALWHDVGKINKAFQKKLRGGGTTADAFRHEWLSLRLFQAFVGTEKDDRLWLERLAALGREEKGLSRLAKDWLKALCKDTNDGMAGSGGKSATLSCPPAFATLPPLARVIAWLVLGHHRLPVKQDGKAPTADNIIRQPLKSIVPGWGYVHAVEAKALKETWSIEEKDLPCFSRLWRERVARIARKLLDRPEMLETDWLDNTYALHVSRLGLMLADHIHSAQDAPERRLCGDAAYAPHANSDRQTHTPRQKLDEHLVGVERLSSLVLWRLGRLRETLPAVGHLSSRRFRKRSEDARFRWQDKASDLAASLAARSAEQGFFGLDLASTGCGKTLANGRICHALAGEGGLRFTVALGLRTLTRQTGDAYRVRLGLGRDELAVLAGDQAVRELHARAGDAEDGDMPDDGSESRAALFQADVLYEGLPDGPLARWLAATPGAAALVSAPVLACTIVCLLVFVVMLGMVYAQKKKLKLAYENLFRRNKEMVQAEQANEARRDEYERRIARLEEDNKRLDSQLEQQQQQQQRQPADEQGRPATPAGGEAKYSSSKVTDEQRDIILQRINKVMRNPENFCDSNFSLDKLSTLVGSNSRYVSQIINETLGKNFRSFISEYRINEAQLRLLDTNNYGNYTIRAIGESVGYKSQANFIDAFRRQTGMLPSIYQKMAQGDA